MIAYLLIFALGVWCGAWLAWRRGWNAAVAGMPPSTTTAIASSRARMPRPSAIGCRNGKLLENAPPKNRGRCVYYMSAIFTPRSEGV